jgi:NADH:ubiquinone oxidoreductase subunit K
MFYSVEVMFYSVDVMFYSVEVMFYSVEVMFYSVELMFYRVEEFSKTLLNCISNHWMFLYWEIKIWLVDWLIIV